MNTAVIVSAARTPIAKYRGEYAGITIPQLGAIAIQAAAEKAGLAPEKIDEVIFGNLFGSDCKVKSCIVFHFISYMIAVQIANSFQQKPPFTCKPPEQFLFHGRVGFLTEVP